MAQYAADWRTELTFPIRSEAKLVIFQNLQFGLLFFDFHLRCRSFFLLLLMLWWLHKSWSWFLLLLRLFLLQYFLRDFGCLLVQLPAFYWRGGALVCKFSLLSLSLLSFLLLAFFLFLLQFLPSLFER